MAEEGTVASSNWNQKNPAVRRIMADVRELARDPSDQYAAKPTEENMFEWHFVIRGPQGTDFEGGRYHGKILLPSEYPFKPPHIVFLTSNGRWETKTKICLSMSAFHPEDWQPAWGIRTMLEALISFMPSPSDGALGAIDSPPEVRRRLALESRSYTHPLMPQLPELGSCGTNVAKSKEMQDAIAQMRMQASKDAPATEEADENEALKEKDRPTEVTLSPAQSGETASDQAPINVPEAPVIAAESTADHTAAEDQNVTVDVVAGDSNDPVDGILRLLSWVLLFTAFVLSYRKALVTFAPEL